MGKENRKNPRRDGKRELTASSGDALFHRVAAILEQARTNVVRSVNTNMVLAYWLIGREIVQALQGGQERAEYGQEVLVTLSKRLATRYGQGFSVPNLKNFRQFFLVYSDRMGIRYPSGSESGPDGKSSPTGSQFSGGNLLSRTGRESGLAVIRHPAGSESLTGFSSLLSWSHYRALMRVQDGEAREFYEREAAECGWSKAQLERQIQSAYYQRIVANRGKAGLTASNREKLPGESIPPETILKSPYVLEFLDLPDSLALHESDLEQAIIDNLQSFLLELGKGFSFVARQKHIRFDDDDSYIDLVFYNFILKCFVLIDLKIGKLTHRDVGQIDGYVRYYEDHFKVPGDNLPLGLHGNPG